MVTKLKASVRFRSSKALLNSPPHATDTNNADIHNVQNSISESPTVERSLCDKRMPACTMSDIQSDQSHLPEKTKEEPNSQKPRKATGPQITHSKYVKDKSLASQKGQHKVVATKETQVVRSVILVAVIFVTCQMPLMMYTLARRFESQFDDQDDLTSKNLQKMPPPISKITGLVRIAKARNESLKYC
ncbi:hypothetical protein RRG08_002229 [Elysia crispata]|uniref:Uncharacterized protein n=1 Tax=Elysia crispata TaxID=231223 RepID=A0AAE0ZC64_9GAST|nr:hypothetical protein RRG08_002229 [Elysia crispata]